MTKSDSLENPGAREALETDPVDEFLAERRRTRRRMVVGALLFAAAATLALRWALDDSIPDHSGRVETGLPPAVDGLFRDALPELVVALNGWGRAEREEPGGGLAAASLSRLEELETQLTDEAASRLIGSEATERLAELFVLARAGEMAPESERSEVARRLNDTSAAVNRALEASDLPLFVDAGLFGSSEGGAFTVIYTYLLEDQRRYRAGDEEYRTLYLRRLDALNVNRRRLGMAAGGDRPALVILQQVDELLVEVLLPALARDGQVDLVGADGRDGDPSAWERELGARAGEIVREELGQTISDQRKGEELGRLLSQRRQLYDRMSERLTREGIVIVRPKSLRVSDPETLREHLRGRVSPDDLREFSTIERELAGRSYLELFGSLRNLLASSVARHEVQHCIDDARDYRGIAEHMPLGDRAPFALSAEREYSAYLAELARDRQTVKTNLMLLVRFLTMREEWGTAESYAALSIFRGLHRQLGLAGGDELVVAGRIDTRRVAALAIELSHRTGDELREAAGRLWEESYGRPLPEIQLVD